MDDKGMTSVISKLAEVDPIFREVMENLYPEVDPREMWDLSKSMPGQADVHVARNEKRKKIALAAGLGVGAVAEGLGVRSSLKGSEGSIAAVKSIQPAFAEAKSIGGKLRALRPAGGKVGSTAFQGANLVVGLAAGRELLKKPKKDFGKGLDMELFEPILKARREGNITTDKALELIEMVEKGVAGKAVKETAAAAKAGGSLIFHPIKQGKLTARSVREIHETATIAPFVGATQEAMKADYGRQVGESVLHGRTILGGAAATGVGIAGYRHGKKKEKAKLRSSALSPFAKGATVKQALAGYFDDEPESSVYEFTGDISKMDEDKRQVFGWCSLSTVDGRPVVDLQNDYISIEEIEKSAYEYVKTSRKGGDMHARVGEEPLHTSDMIESVIITPDKLKKMGVPEEAISKVHTGWWVGYQINDDDQWAKVKNGERTGFSIHGKGARIEKVLND